MPFPLIGSIGKVSKKADIKHIANPVEPIKVNCVLDIVKNKPAKANVMKIPAHSRKPLNRSVKFSE